MRQRVNRDWFHACLCCPCHLTLALAQWHESDRDAAAVTAPPGHAMSHKSEPSSIASSSSPLLPLLLPSPPADAGRPPGAAARRAAAAAGRAGDPDAGLRRRGARAGDAAGRPGGSACPCCRACARTRTSICRQHSLLRRLALTSVNGCCHCCCGFKRRLLMLFSTIPLGWASLQTQQA